MLGGREVKVYGIEKNRVRVGRDVSNDVMLDHPGVSRFHFEIVKIDERYFVTDCGSANGTFANGLKCRTHALEPGDVLQIAKYHLFVDFAESIDGVQSESETPRILQDCATIRSPHLSMR